MTDKYYFGLILMESTVVAIIKNENKISVVPTGKIFSLNKTLFFQEIST